MCITSKGITVAKCLLNGTTRVMTISSFIRFFSVTIDGRDNPQRQKNSVPTQHSLCVTCITSIFLNRWHHPSPIITLFPRVFILSRNCVVFRRFVIYPLFAIWLQYVAALMKQNLKAIQVREYSNFQSRIQLTLQRKALVRLWHQ